MEGRGVGGVHLHSNSGGWAARLACVCVRVRHGGDGGSGGSVGGASDLPQVSHGLLIFLSKMHQGQKDPEKRVLYSQRDATVPYMLLCLKLVLIG